MNEIKGNLAVEAKTFYERTLVQRLLPELLFLKYGQKKSYAKNKGKTISFRKFESLPVQKDENGNVKALAEGVTPDGQDLTVTEITATVKQYGDYIPLTDEVDMVAIDPVLTESSELCGEQAGLTLDTVARDIICAGTNVQYAGGVVSANEVVGKLTFEEVKKAVRTLKKANAKKLAGNCFIGIVDPETSYDLQNDPAFIDISKYNGGEKLEDGEIGKLGGVRFIETTNTYVDSHNNHYVKIIGKDAYGVVDINGKSKPEIIVKPLGSSGTEDPLNQRGTVGWKANMTAVRLNELAMLSLIVKVSE